MQASKRRLPMGVNAELVRTTMVSKQQDGGMRVVGLFATMAQLVARIICTDKVVGSIPACGSSLTNKR